MSKRLVILGAGESGVGAAILGRAKDYDVFVSDKGAITEKYKDVLLKYQIQFEELQHTKEQILSADVVVKSPGIPDSVLLIQELLTKGIPVISEIEFGSWYTNAKLIGITGSNGKTTTTSLTYHILKESGLNVGLGGNIGKSFAWQVAECEYDYYVLELSSFQLDGIEKLKLDVSVLLNITPDHLDRYDYKIENYIQSKFRIVKNNDKNSVFIYNSDDENIKSALRNVTFNGVSYPFSINGLSGVSAGSIGNDLVIDINKPLRISGDKVSLRGKHNSYNIMASVSVACALGIDEKQILVAVYAFQPIEHRMERVIVLNDVAYINDSKATNVDSVFYALDSLNNNVIWIAGGVDKGNDYSQLIPLVKSKVNGIVCLGKNNEKLHAAFGGFVGQMKDASNTDEAVLLASEMAQPGATVLLSPACASFDLFDNYEDRGRKFKNSISKLTSK